MLISFLFHNSENVFVFSEILDVGHLPEGVSVIEDILSFDWKIDTKYYTADVCLCTTENKTIGNKDFADSLEAFVVYFNTKNVSSVVINHWYYYVVVVEQDLFSFLAI